MNRDKCSIFFRGTYQVGKTKFIGRYIEGKAQKNYCEFQKLFRRKFNSRRKYLGIFKEEIYYHTDKHCNNGRADKMQTDHLFQKMLCDAGNGGNGGRQNYSRKEL